MILSCGLAARAAALRPGKYELLRVRLEDRNHFLELLVGHRAKDDPHAFRMVLSQEHSKRTHGSNVVCTIEKKAPTLLQPARPHRRVHTANNILPGNFISSFPEGKDVGAFRRRLN